MNEFDALCLEKNIDVSYTRETFPERDSFRNSSRARAHVDFPKVRKYARMRLVLRVIYRKQVLSRIERPDNRLRSFRRFLGKHGFI